MKPHPSGTFSLNLALPLKVPVRFFLMAPLAVMAAGVILLSEGSSALSSGWSPLTIGLTHLGTLGFLLPVMMGAMYQLAPVVGGSPAPGVRWVLWIQATLALGFASLIWGMVAAQPLAVTAAISLLFPSLAIFIVQMGIALARVRQKIPTIQGMMLALASLAAVMVMGTWMAHGHANMRFPGPRALWIQVHLSLGFLGWLGGLLMAVSWRLVPMFYLAPHFDTRRSRRALLVLGLSLGCTASVPLLAMTGTLPHEEHSRIAGLAALPAAVLVWLLHPVSVLRALTHRRRVRVDPSLYAWVLAMGAAPLLLGVSLMAWISQDGRWQLTLGWLAIWGWAGLVIHGMLTRIVPFLVWMERFAPYVGRVRVPSMGSLYPPAWSIRGLWLHSASILLGVASIWTRLDWLIYLTGASLALTGAHLLITLSRTALRGPEPDWPPLNVGA